jgi:hypothetical protein
VDEVVPLCPVLETGAAGHEHVGQRADHRCGTGRVSPVRVQPSPVRKTLRPVRDR